MTPPDGRRMGGPCARPAATASARRESAPSPPVSGSCWPNSLAVRELWYLRACCRAVLSRFYSRALRTRATARRVRVSCVMRRHDARARADSDTTMLDTLAEERASRKELCSMHA
mmetsp:Transcript_119281/g.166390  ORF Transcript_119281/g.166390 Transcript_119281/m.166390 type:complete len:115 (-) Transcript_119281:142-486(-)|eukprot:scaffold175978_cov28-Tisochrysis_lutea.AAC.1